MKISIWLVLLSFQVFSQALTVEIEEIPTIDLNVTEKTIPTVLMIDDFEDADLRKFREWWTFDKVMIKSKQIEEKKSYSGNVSVVINGSSSNWYAGGVGVYLDEDASYFKTLKLVIYSPKYNSGSIRIELYDDDNNNKIVDIENDKPSKDDLFIYDLNLVWKGWKVVTIPLDEFVDFNNDIGDNIWNPNQLYGSAGLIQMQMVILSSKLKSETIEFEIDTIKFN
tara:strand:+ start:2259 stop:2930 length:672 start_codon:yes stop_codon:yes gene_type:complete